MKHIPILFSTAMVQAILDGRKTQTRRGIKTADIIDTPDRFKYVGNTKTNLDLPHPADDIGRIWHCWELKNSNAKTWIDYCPYGQPGDVLWVRETWAKNEIPTGWPYHYMTDNDLPEVMTWKPSIHMPKAACRMWLRVTNVRVERLQDISEDDAKAEGVEKHAHGFKIYTPETPSNVGVYDACFRSPKDSFESLWHKINGEESWAANPWVWVIEFEPCEMPEGFLT